MRSALLGGLSSCQGCIFMTECLLSTRGYSRGYCHFGNLKILGNTIKILQIMQFRNQSFKIKNLHENIVQELKIQLESPHSFRLESRISNPNEERFKKHVIC
jgi:hypothetical protein